MKKGFLSKNNRMPNSYHNSTIGKLKLGVIVLSWDEAEKTILLLNKLVEQATVGNVAHIVLVDNGSSQKISSRLEEETHSLDPLVHYVKSPINVGFGAGMNLGVDSISGKLQCDYYWFLNNDAMPLDDCIDRFVNYVTKNPGKKIIGTTLIDELTNKIQCAGGCNYNSWLSIDRPYLKDETFETLKSINQETAHFDYIYGASFFVRVDFFLQVGKFNERFFLYFEELELGSHCSRIELGWCKDAIVRHYGGATENSNPNIAAFCAYHAALSSFRFTKNHFFFKLPSVVVARLLGKTFHAIWHKQPILIIAVTKALLDFLVGRTEKNMESF